MCDAELQDMLSSSEMPTQPDPGDVQAVREKMMTIAATSCRGVHRARNVLLTTLVVIGVSGIGLAATERGRKLIRSVFMPVEEAKVVEWVSPDGDTWTHLETGREQPLTPEEKQEVSDQFAENYAGKQAGEGQLVGLLEGPGWAGISHTVYSIEYTRSDGTTNLVGSGRPTGAQAENMRLDEIMELRDSGAGEIIDYQPSPLGMGKYMIRFTLSDGETVDLQTYFPPSTRHEREAIFAEMRSLKADLRFSAQRPFRNPANPLAGVWGILQYQLADGRTVGAVEQIPPAMISEDGTQVIVPGQDEPVTIEAGPPQSE